jgi:hypothetical protein
MMPAYNFQLQFVRMILDLSKPHTIRKRRKHPTKVGDVIKMFVGMRTKRCFQFAEAKCVNIKPLRIYPTYQSIYIHDPKSKHPSLTPDGWRMMSDWEEKRLAKRDGFQTRKEFYHFFERYKLEFLEDFELIIWDVKTLVDMTTKIKLPVGKIQGASANLLIIDDPLNKELPPNLVDWFTKDLTSGRKKGTIIGPIKWQEKKGGEQ